MKNLANTGHPGQIKQLVPRCCDKNFCKRSFDGSMLLNLIFSADTLYGPLHTKEAVKMFLDAVEQAKQQGGTVVCGGKVTKLLFFLLQFVL